MARTSNTMLKRSGEKGHPFLVPDFSRKNFSFLPLSIILAMGLTNSFYYVQMYSLYIHFCKGFCHEWMLNFIKCFFCLSWEDRVVFVFSFVDAVCGFESLELSQGGLCACMYVLVCVYWAPKTLVVACRLGYCREITTNNTIPWLSICVYILYKYSRSKWFMLWVGMQVSGRNLGENGKPSSSQSSWTVLALWFQVMFYALCLHVSPLSPEPRWRCLTHWQPPSTGNLQANLGWVSLCYALGWLYLVLNQETEEPRADPNNVLGLHPASVSSQLCKLSFSEPQFCHLNQRW